MADFMVERGYIGRDVPLLKRVMGGAGATGLPHRHSLSPSMACRLGDALDRDRMGRVTCRSGRAAGVSLDGRHFPHESRCSGQSWTAAISARSAAKSVIGLATPIYTDEDGDGRFIWRAATR